MAAINFLGPPSSFSTTTPSATITRIKSATFSGVEFEKIEERSGVSVYKCVVLGNANASVTIRSTDLTLKSTYADGMTISALTLTWLGAAVNANTSGTLTRSGNGWRVTFSSGKVMKAIQVEGDGEGKKPAEFELQIDLAIDQSTGNDPTFTDVAL